MHEVCDEGKGLSPCLQIAMLIGNEMPGAELSCTPMIVPTLDAVWISRCMCLQCRLMQPPTQEVPIILQRRKQKD